MLRQIVVIVLLLSCFSQAVWAGEDLAPVGDKLLKVVVLSRHGVRSPTQSDKMLEMWSQKEWPQWPVPKGDLTPRGALLATAMWQNLGAKLRDIGFLPNSGVPKIYVRADLDERTRATAKAIMEGLAPNSGLKYHVASTELDPLFHPVKAGLYRFDPIDVATDVLANTHGGLERLADEFSGAMQILDGINGSPSPTLCSRFAMMPKCKLTDLPNALSVSPDGTAIHIVGSLGIASSLAEIFLLEYGEWPDQNAGWGSVDQRVLGQVLPIHSRIFDVVNRARLVSWANGGALLDEMARALLGRHESKEINDASMVIYVGHDTNIANVGGLLNIHWQATGYPPNGIPPAGALFLELWERGGKQYVHARFEAQPPQALHRAFTDRTETRAFAPSGVLATVDNAPLVYSVSRFESLVLKAVANAPGIGLDQNIVAE